MSHPWNLDSPEGRPRGFWKVLWTPQAVHQGWEEHPVPPTSLSVSKSLFHSHSSYQATDSQDKDLGFFCSMQMCRTPADEGIEEQADWQFRDCSCCPVRGGLGVGGQGEHQVLIETAQPQGRGHACAGRGCRDGETGFPDFGVELTECGLVGDARLLTWLPGR